MRDESFQLTTERSFLESERWAIEKFIIICTRSFCFNRFLGCNLIFYCKPFLEELPISLFVWEKNWKHKLCGTFYIRYILGLFGQLEWLHSICQPDHCPEIYRMFFNCFSVFMNGLSILSPVSTLCNWMRKSHLKINRLLLSKNTAQRIYEFLLFRFISCIIL